MQLTSPVFINQGLIPEEYAFKGKNRNPQLDIAKVPKQARSLAIIMHDPDGWGGRDFLHWMVWNIPAGTTRIDEGMIPEGATVGANSKGIAGYMRPTPLANSGVHHYIFELYALDTLLDIPVNAGRALVENAINAHTIERTELIGLYSR